MKKKILPFAAATLILASVQLAAAQQPAKRNPQIGVLYSGLSGVAAPQLDGFRQELRELGYTEGKNIAIEYRFAEGKLDRLPDLAADLVRLKVAVIVAVGGTPAILAANNVASTIPIVFPAVGDPVVLGIGDSLARPGRNMTGLTVTTLEFSGKRLEILKEVAPRPRQVAVLGQGPNAFTALDVKNLQAPASALGLQLHRIAVRGPADFDSAFSKITGTVRATGLFLQSTALFLDNRKRIADLATKSRLPAISDFRELRRLVFSCPTERIV